MGRPPVVAEKMIELKKGQWAPHEDIKLVSYVEEHGASKWNLVPENAGLQRSGKSCRSRWMNHLRPGIKQGKFTADEEQIIIRHQARLGNRWAAIASHLAGRTDNSVKNYWYTHLKKKLGKVNNHGDEATGNSIAAPFSHAPPAPATTTALGREGFYYPPNILRSSPAPSTTPGRVDFYYQSSIFLPLGSDQISFGPF